MNHIATTKEYLHHRVTDAVEGYSGFYGTKLSNDDVLSRYDSTSFRNRVNGFPLIFLGDANHTVSRSLVDIQRLCMRCVQLDPILAQGAGIAIEDAAKITKLLVSSSNQSLSPSDSLTNLHKSMSIFEESKHSRISKLQRISDAAHFLGHINRYLITAVFVSYLRVTDCVAIVLHW